MIIRQIAVVFGLWTLWDVAMSLAGVSLSPATTRIVIMFIEGAAAVALWNIATAIEALRKP